MARMQIGANINHRYRLDVGGRRREREREDINRWCFAVTADLPSEKQGESKLGTEKRARKKRPGRRQAGARKSRQRVNDRRLKCPSPTGQERAAHRIDKWSVRFAFVAKSSIPCVAYTYIP